MPVAVLVGVLAPLALHAALLTVDFALAWSARGERPAGEPRTGFARALGAWLVAYVREIADSTRTFSWAQPMLAARPFPGGTVVAERLPVLLVHGYFCNRALWHPMAARLVAAGHNALYRDERRAGRWLWEFLTRECPASILVAWRTVLAELARRAGTSGLVEKASRSR